jgi:ribosome maturation factor RimP|tara:strand:+ start:1578 stop:1859 length:282 start_codon:yes stop_codon:yes gene_type:complete
MSENLREKLVNIIRKECETTEYKFVDLELSGGPSSLKLVIYIDKDKGINIDDCVKFNKVINDIDGFDDLFESSYVLEVSSPGTHQILEEGESK